MLELKNPFALRDGKMICIYDLTKHDSGLACNCTCALCHEPMIARMGDVNRHHFAHSSAGCSNEKAMRLSFYRMLQQNLNERMELYLPGLYATYRTIKHPIYEASVDKDFWWHTCRDEIRGRRYHEVITERLFHIEETKFYPEIELFEVLARGGRFQIVLQYERKNCDRTTHRQRIRSAQQNISVLSIDLCNLWALLEEKQPFDLTNLFLFDPHNRFWVYHRKMPEASVELARIMNDEYKKRQQAEQQRLAETHSIAVSEHTSAPAKRMAPPESTGFPADTDQDGSALFGLVNRLRSQKKVKSEPDQTLDSFNAESAEIQRDSAGYRWFKCEQCQRILSESEISDYGGKRPVNYGVCSSCMRKK